MSGAKTYTAILKLVQPAFDQAPWDTDINNDLAVLDAAVGKFFGTANLVGVWQNATLYSAGQVAVDNTDGSMWSCNIQHTSAVAPTTFAQDRTANPSNWIQAASTAQDYAQQASTFASNASTSATNSANSATAAANSATAAVGALPLSGGTLTGPLLLAADPGSVLGAATKQYVDARVGGVGYLPITGGTLTGLLTLSGAPTANLHAATKAYADTKLALAGGTVSGALTVNGQTVVNSANGMVLSGVSLNYWRATTPSIQLAFESSWRWDYTRSTGAMNYLRGTDNVNLFTISPSGLVTTPGGFYTVGRYTLGSGGFFGYDNTYVYTYQDANNWHWIYTRSTGDMVWVDGSGASHWYMRSDGFNYSAINSTGGNGAYVNISDERIKHDIAELAYGLAELDQLVPVSFVRDGRDYTEVGFTAQDVMKSIPEAVLALEPELLAVRSEAILAVAVRAIQQLSQRVAQLEAR